MGLPGVNSTNISKRAPVADEFLVNRDGSTAIQTYADLSAQLAGTGAVAQRLDLAAEQSEAAAEGYVIGTTWLALAAISGSRSGQPGRVPRSDTGTHVDPVSGLAVPNSGEFAWSTVPAGWTRTGDVIDQAGLITLISGKAAQSELDKVSRLLANDGRTVRTVVSVGDEDDNSIARWKDDGSFEAAGFRMGCASETLTLESLSGYRLITVEGDMTMRMPRAVVTHHRDIAGVDFALVDSDGNLVPISGAGGGTVVPDYSAVERSASNLFASVAPNQRNAIPRLLPKYRLAMARLLSGTGRVKVACIGDSTTAGFHAGVGGDNVGATLRAWPYKTSALLTAHYAPATSDSKWGSQSESMWTEGADPRASAGAGWTLGDLSLGNQMPTNSTTTNPYSFTPENDVNTIDVYYLASSGGGTFTVDTGGAALATIDASVASAGVTKATVAVTRGHPTVNIKRVSGAVQIVGLDAYDNAAPAVSVWNMGWGGSMTSHWASADLPRQPINALQAVAPDLTIINLGINDANNSVSATTFRANYEAIIAAARVSGDVVMFVPAPSGQFLENNAALYAVMRQMAVDLAIPLIDFPERFGTHDEAADFFIDSTHPNYLGHADMAWAVFKMLSI